LVDNLQDIIWVLNPKNDSLESLAAYIREYALKYFDSMDVTLLFHYPARIPVIKLTEEIRRNIFLVFKETFTNIAKHAGCSSVSVELNITGESFEFRISDNGKGFERSEVRNFANGLQNMQNRMEQAGGKFQLNAFPGRGTQTILAISN
jgi:signal transduction histidine kinase